MRRFFLSALFTLFSVLLVFSQDPVATLQHAGGTQVFYGINSLESAYQQSTDGDTIVLSVGSFSIPQAIMKGLVIIGAGHFPDSVTVKKRTLFLGNMSINVGASSNLNIEGVREMITDIKSISWEAASKFDNESVDFVFIDAGHDYESVTKDISCWFPKIKKGGIISGHDYFNSIEFGGNFGVKKAVDEFFGEKNLQFFEYCWYIKKN